MFDTNIPAVTPETFNQEVLQSDLPVFVDYFAPWCGPCRMAAPRVAALAAEYAGRAKVVAMDCEAHKDWVKSDRGLRAVPTLEVYHKGEMVGVVSGANVLPALGAMFKSHALPE